MQPKHSQKLAQAQLHRIGYFTAALNSLVNVIGLSFIQSLVVVEFVERDTDSERASRQDSRTSNGKGKFLYYQMRRGKGMSVYDLLLMYC
jgi:hypothetical protein